MKDDELSTLETILGYIIGAAFAVVFVGAIDASIYFVWNHAIAEPLHLPRLGFWTIFGILFLLGWIARVVRGR